MHLSWRKGPAAVDGARVEYAAPRGALNEADRAGLAAAKTRRALLWAGGGPGGHDVLRGGIDPRGK